MFSRLSWISHSDLKQIFGFGYNMSHTEIFYDANEQIDLRYRLFARAIRINGVSQIDVLQPYLEARLVKTIAT